VDAGGYSDPQDARAKESKNGRDRAEAKAERGSNVSKSMGSWSDTGGGSREERGIGTAHYKVVGPLNVRLQTNCCTAPTVVG
jgi:hypothetical protein